MFPKIQGVAKVNLEVEEKKNITKANMPHLMELVVIIEPNRK